MTDFTNSPVSISEARAERSRDCKDWTPRDALVSLLREIDAGDVKVDALVICYREVVEDGSKTHFNMAAPDATVGLGLLSRAAWQINEG